MKPLHLSFVAISLLCLAGCATGPRCGESEPRTGDEIVTAGQFFHTGTRVVLWMDPGGYDAYRVERRFAPWEQADWKNSVAAVPTLKTPNRYGLRKHGLTPSELEQVRGGGWDLPTLRRIVDQFVLHFDVCGTSRTCFFVLHDDRDLSVHFLLDVDGTIYQTLDLKERAWHATTSNDRSVGVEIANIGAYPAAGPNPFAKWYTNHADGPVSLQYPNRFGSAGIWTTNFVGHPARPEPVHGTIQGQELVQYDYTPEQYAALEKLTATLCRVFPRISCDYPKDSAGQLIPHKLPSTELENYHGVLGHYHIQTDKVDPGPALDWEKLIGGARKILQSEDLKNASPIRTRGSGLTPPLPTKN